MPRGHRRGCSDPSTAVGRRVKLGNLIKVSIIELGWIGKQFTFKIRANRQPAVTITALAPGTTKPCPGC